jgi:hypothetical protein
MMPPPETLPLPPVNEPPLPELPPDPPEIEIVPDRVMLPPLAGIRLPVIDPAEITTPFKAGELVFSCEMFVRVPLLILKLPQVTT